MKLWNPSTSLCWARPKARQLQWSMLCVMKSKDQICWHMFSILSGTLLLNASRRHVLLTKSTTKNKQADLLWKEVIWGVRPLGEVTELQCYLAICCVNLRATLAVPQVLPTLRLCVCCYLLACPGIIFFFRWEEFCRLLMLRPYF